MNLRSKYSEIFKCTDLIFSLFEDLERKRERELKKSENN